MAKFTNKFKIGDKVEITNDTSTHKWVSGTEVLVTGENGYFYQGADAHGSQRDFYEDDAKLKTTSQTPVLQNKNTQLTMITRQQMKDAVLQVAQALCVANNTVSTLEIKDKCRVDFPAVNWNQYDTKGVPGVSNLFWELRDEGKFVVVADNGTYRTYADATNKSTGVQPTHVTQAPVPAPATKVAKVKKVKVTVQVNISPIRISKTKAVELIKNNKGRFFTAKYIKQDGTERVINAQYLKDQTPSPLGYVLVKEASKLKTKNPDSIRNLNLQTLKELKIAGGFYKVR